MLANVLFDVIVIQTRFSQCLLYPLQTPPPRVNV